MITVSADWEATALKNKEKKAEEKKVYHFVNLNLN